MTIEIKGLGLLTGSKEALLLLEADFRKAGEGFDSTDFKYLSKHYREIARDIHKEVKIKNYI